MKDQTELAPCPFCGGPAMENKRGEIQCSVAVCRLVESMPVAAWNSRPDLRRIKELEELANGLSDTANARGSRIKELEEKVAKLRQGLEFIMSSQPCHREGSIFIEHFDGDGNPIGEESVDTVGLLGWIYEKVGKTLHETT